MVKLTNEQQLLLTHCKFYKGEAKPPKGKDFFFWEAEERYVRESGIRECPPCDYDEFINMKFDGVYQGLVPFLFDMYEHIEHHRDCLPTKEGFVEFVKEYAEAGD